MQMWTLLFRWLSWYIARQTGRYILIDTAAGWTGLLNLLRCNRSGITVLINLKLKSITITLMFEFRSIEIQINNGKHSKWKRSSERDIHVKDSNRVRSGKISIPQLSYGQAKCGLKYVQTEIKTKTKIIRILGKSELKPDSRRAES